MIESTIRGALRRDGLQAVPVFRGRVPNGAKVAGSAPVPMILYSQTGIVPGGTLEPSIAARTFEIECRGATPEAAQRLSEIVLAGFAGTTGRALEEFDKRSDASATLGKYYAHTMEVQL